MGIHEETGRRLRPRKWRVVIRHGQGASVREYRRASVAAAMAEDARQFGFCDVRLERVRPGRL